MKANQTEENNRKIWNLEKLKNEEMVTQYQHAMDRKLCNGNEVEGDVIKKWDSLKTSTLQVADQCIGEKAKERNVDWFDEECRQVIQEKMKQGRKCFLGIQEAAGKNMES